MKAPTSELAPVFPLSVQRVVFLGVLALVLLLCPPARADTSARILALADRAGVQAALREAEEARLPPAKKARLLGHLHLRARDVEAARTHLGRALELDPSQDAAWLELALAEHLAGDPQASLRALERGRALGQSRPTFYALAAENLRALEDPQAAHRMLAAGLSRFSSDLALLRAELELELSVGLVATATRTAARLVPISPEPVLERRWIARRLVELGAPAVGAALLEAARAAAPGNMDVAAELAWAYVEAGAPRAAARAIDPARLKSARYAFESAEQYRAAGALQDALRANRYVAVPARRAGQRAVILVELGRLDQARAAAAGVDPAALSDGARFALAYAAAYTGAPAEAARWLDRIEAPSRLPGLPELRRALERARR